MELRLAPGASPVDFSLRLRTAREARGVALGLPPPTRNFLALWAEPGGPLAAVRTLWMEFDLDREGDAPVVCAKLPRDPDLAWLTETLLPALQGRPLPGRQRDLIRTCIGALPASAILLYAFNLQARGSDAIRLEIFGLELDGILGYLQKMRPEASSAVEKVLPFFEEVERLHLSFDVTDEILPRIGLEGSFPRQPRREPRWAAFLERLVQRGLCMPEKRDALLAWPGYDTFWTAPLRWPVAELGPRGACIRLLSHLKVVCGPDRQPEAKAYLVLGPPDRSSEGAPASRSTLST